MSSTTWLVFKDGHIGQSHVSTGAPSVHSLIHPLLSRVATSVMSTEPTLPPPPPQLKAKQGVLEFKVKTEKMFQNWITVHAKMEGRWLALYKKADSVDRIAAIELGHGVQLKNYDNIENYARRFDITCTGGALQAIEWNFRSVGGRRERDLWAKAILKNLDLFNAHGNNVFPHFQQYESVVQDMMTGLPTAVRLIPRVNHMIKKSKDVSKVPLHAKSFLGYDAVSFLTSRKIAATTADAEAICHTLASMNLIHHLVWAQGFSINELFCFTQDQNTNTCVQIFDSMIELGKFWIYLPIPIAIAYAHTTTTSPRKEAGFLLSAMSSSSNTLPTFRNASSGRQTSSVRSPSSHSGSDASKESGGVEILDEGRWADAEAAKHCHCCEKSFNPLKRKHHCRLCGYVVCSTCGVHTTVGHVNRAVNVRVCIKCRLRMKLSQESASSSSSSRHPPHRPAPPPHSVSAPNLLISHPRHSLMATTSYSDPSLAVPAHQWCSVCYDCDNKCQPQFSVSTDFPLDFDWEHPWPRPPRRLNEALCVQMLDQTLVCTQPDPWFDQLCDVLVSNTGCEKAVIGFMADAGYILMGTAGFDLPGDDFPKVVAHDLAFAPHALMSAEPLVCCDAGEDIRFAQNSYMRNEWHVGFYASFPLVVSCGLILGTIEVYDASPRRQCHNVQVHLDAVAKLVVQYLDDLIDQSKKTNTSPPPPPTGDGVVSASMEGTLLQLLEKTTGTQSQLQQQQAQMVHAVGNHSQQINLLAEKLQRMEAAIDRKQARDDAP
ncbi:hypothetical protein B5M09_012177 [Aphanomyces astaci]|uniref:FYVE-type domain-containing protein n=2 Tax=Aphanomyces astaci TaxID=112090 RepID=A0A3R8DM35_APHAT|nr:hypothetical protein B5M09_012177 [Aphanomyces astaci]